MRKKARILETVHETAKGLHRAGLVDEVTMREFDTLCLPAVKKLSARDISRLRRKHRLSQSVFALYLNTSPSTVRQWEQGQKALSGPSLKLLNLVVRKGLSALT